MGLRIVARHESVGPSWCLSCHVRLNCLLHALRIYHDAGPRFDRQESRAPEWLLGHQIRLTNWACNGSLLYAKHVFLEGVGLVWAFRRLLFPFDPVGFAGRLCARLVRVM